MSHTAQPVDPGVYGDYQDAAAASAPAEVDIAHRSRVLGDPVASLCDIAQVWSGILGHTVQPHEVPLMMAGLKLVRTRIMPNYSDSSDDVVGYIDIFRRVIGEDMIHARTVEEFLQKGGLYHD